MSRQRDFRSINVKKDSIGVAQNGQRTRENIRLAGWINSCRVQFGQLGKLPKTKFTAFLQQNLPDRCFSSSWNTQFVRTLRKRAEDSSIRQKIPKSKSQTVPEFPPVPNRLSGMDRYNLLFQPLAFTAFVRLSKII